MDRSEEIVDNPDGWAAEHLRQYVATGGWNTLLLVTRGRRSAAALVTGQGITVEGGHA